MFVLLFVYATIAHYPGTHLWGYVGLLWAATLQIIAGMFFACFDPPHHAHHIWIKQMKRMTSRLIRIFFAGTAAFPIPVTKLLSLEAFWKGSILGIFACVTTKVFCAPFIGKARSVIGWATTAKEANMATSQAAFVDEKVDGISGACGALRSWCAMVRLRESSQASPIRHWWLSHAGPVASPAKLSAGWPAVVCHRLDAMTSLANGAPEVQGTRAYITGVLPADAIDSDRWCNDGDDEEDDPGKQ